MRLLFLLLFLTLFKLAIVSKDTNNEDEDTTYTNSWAVKIEGGDEVANKIAETHGFINRGQVGSLEGFYHFVHAESPAKSRRSLGHKHTALMAEEKVLHAEQQTVLKRQKRDYVPPTDPWWEKQWYMHRTNKDMNVKPVWEQGITGKGVVVTILDDGIEHDHPDLKDNYDPDASYDFNHHDADPFPRYDPTNENKHGTRCAGEVSAIKNDVCTVGVAYKSSIGGVRMLDGDVTDVVEASSLSLNPQHVHIYSSSWGPNDDGRTVDGPGKLARKAFLDGITKGRGGLGSLFVWASGNGGSYQDSCNCDGYAVSPYTLTISSVTEHGKFPWYAEECSANLACTYSSGSGGEHQVITTDLHHKCTTRHTGTSASAPMTAGLLALALEVNPNLSWRDVQYILVYSSNPRVAQDSSWATNGAGLRFSHKYGFGLIDAAALVNRARHWVNVPERHSCSVTITNDKHDINNQNPLELRVTVSKNGNCSSIGYLEHVQVYLTISVEHSHRGNLHVSIQSPQRTKSTLLPTRKHDRSKKGFENWPFMTVFSWGEDPEGEWQLDIKAYEDTRATLESGTLVLHGVQYRPRVIRDIPEKCSEECKGGCAKAGPQFCDTCKHYRMATTLECVSSCPMGTYLDQTMCRPCIKNCHVCTNGSFCVQCSPGVLRISGGLCLQKCPASTYQAFKNNTCYECHTSCKSCNGPTRLNCTQCLSSQYHLLEGACVLATNCTPGQYFDSRSFQCRACHESCAECNGRDDTDCNACYPGRVLTDGRCVASKSSCSKGEYFNEGTNACAICPPGCSSCTDGISCVHCQSEYFLHESRVGNSDELKVICVKKCPAGYYGNSGKSCSACPPYCGTCSSLANCLTCANSNINPMKGMCPQPCGSGEYYSSTSGNCQPCTGDCKECVGENVCSSCKEQLLLDMEGHCGKTCPDHTVANPDTGHCESLQCHESCATCNGPEPDQCLSCAPSRVLKQGTCVDSCPTGQIMVDNSCVDCDSSCASCTGVTDAECLSCKTGSYLDNHSCVSSCRHGTFIKDGLCLSCPAGCITCTNSTHCIKCDKRYTLYQPSHKCLTNCPKGYYEIENTCHPCIVGKKCQVPTASSSVVPKGSRTPSSTSSNVPLIVFLIILSILIVALFVFLLLWKRDVVLKVLTHHKKKYKVLYSSPDKLNLNGIVDEETDSETEVFVHH